MAYIPRLLCSCSPSLRRHLGWSRRFPWTLLGYFARSRSSCRGLTPQVDCLRQPQPPLPQGGWRRPTSQAFCERAFVSQTVAGRTGPSAPREGPPSRAVKGTPGALPGLPARSLVSTRHHPSSEAGQEPRDQGAIRTGATPYRYEIPRNVSAQDTFIHYRLNGNQLVLEAVFSPVASSATAASRSSCACLVPSGFSSFARGCQRVAASSRWDDRRWLGRRLSPFHPIRACGVAQAL